MDQTNRILSKMRRICTILVSAAALVLGAYIAISLFFHYLPDLQNLVTTDLVFLLLLWLVIAAAVPVCISAIRGKKLCFLQEFAVFCTFYTSLLMLENLFAIGRHIHLLYQLSYGMADILDAAINFLPGVLHMGLAAVSGILLYRVALRRRQSFLITAIGLAAAAYAVYFLRWHVLLHFHLFYLLVTVMVLLHKKKRN